MKNTFVKVLSMMMALMMVVGMFSVITVSAADHEHTKGEYIDGKDPTCQKPGFSRWICGICEEEWITDIIQPSDEYHDIEEVPAISASCLTAGYSAGRRCLVTGCTEIEEGCELVAPAKAHTFVGKEVAPTCFDKGWVVYTCTACNYTAEQLSGDAELGVDFDNDGVKDNKFLFDGQTYADWARVETGKAQLTHKYEWTVVTAPQNTKGVCSDGLAKGVCANCEDAQTTVIPVEHNYVLINEKNLPCIEWNNQAKWCSNCHKIQPGDENKKHETTGHGAAVTFTGKLDPTDDDFNAYITAGHFTLKQLFEDIELELGDELYVPAGCTTDGYQLVKCSCGLLYLKSEAAKGHDWSDWSGYSTPTLCTEPSVKTRTCERNCGVAPEVSVYAPAAHSAHAYKNDVTKPTCTEMGFTTTTCTNTITINGQTYKCGYSDVNTWVDKLGHAWSDAILISGSCDNGDWDKECTREGCNETYEDIVGGTVTPTAAQKKHAWGDKVPVAGTCHEKSYSYKQCSKCKYYYVSDTVVSKTLTNAAKLRDDNDKIDATNHEYEFDRWADETPTSCTVKSAVAIVKCKYCDVDGNTEITRTINNPVAHTEATGYITVSGNTKVPHAGGRSATCQYVGYEADGKYCSVCLTVLKAPTEIAMNPANHVDTPDDDNKIGAYVEATCQSDAYQKHYLSCCKEINVYTPNTKKANCEEGYTTVPYDAADCLTNGNHQYRKCKWCDTIEPDSVVTTGCTQCTAAQHEAAEFANNPVIAALGHKFPANNNVGNFVENDGGTADYPCDDTIVLAHKNCLNDGCDYVQFNNVTYKSNTDKDFLAVARQLPHYNAYKQIFVDQDSTCTSAGIYGDEYCTVCQKDQWIDPIDDHNFAHSIEDKIFRINYKNGADINCTLDACIVIECADCTAKKTQYFYAVDGKHNMTNWADVTIDGPSCKNDQMQERHCLDCATGVTVETRVKENGAKTGCYTTKGVVNGEKFFISYDCDKIAEFIGWSCDVCGDVVDETDLKHNVGDPEIQNPTCTADGHLIKYCKGCGLTERENSIAFYEPIYNVLTPADGNYSHNKAEGIVLEDNAEYTKYICKDCKETVTENKPVATPSDDIAVVLGKYNTLEIAGDKYTNASQVAITVALKTEQAINVNMINLQVQYSNNLKYDGFAFADGIEFTSFQDAADNNDDSYDKDGNFVEGAADFISITAATEFDKGQAPVDAVIDGELQLVTLYFTIVNAKGSEANASVAVTVAEFYNTKSDNKLDVVLGSSATCAIKVEKFMDVNGNGYFNAKDLAIAAELFADDAYNVAADVDKDGEITYTDLIAIQDYINGVRTYDEIAALGSEA